jgi:hypothetical protein
LNSVFGPFYLRSIMTGSAEPNAGPKDNKQET